MNETDSDTPEMSLKLCGAASRWTTTPPQPFCSLAFSWDTSLLDPRVCLQRTQATTDVSCLSLHMYFHPQDLCKLQQPEVLHRHGPKILYPSLCIQSYHHNYKSQETQQQFSLTHQIAANSHSTFIKLENLSTAGQTIPLQPNILS